MRTFVSLLVLGATLLANPAPPYRQAESAEPVVYKLQIAPAPLTTDRDACSPERRQIEKDALNRGYFISRDYDNNITLLPHAVASRKFVFDVYQEQADAFNWYDGTLVCYEGRVGDRVLTPSCNISISPCQKAALKEAAKENK